MESEWSERGMGEREWADSELSLGVTQAQTVRVSVCVYVRKMWEKQKHRSERNEKPERKSICIKHEISICRAVRQ